MPATISVGARARWLECGLIALVGAALCAWTWRTWADPLVDYGRELYGAWRLSVGDRLGLDLAWLQGPLSVEWNALLFRVFGSSYRTLFLADLCVLAACVALVRGLLARAYGRFGATAGVLVALAIVGFGQYAVVGNYSFAAPYSHELTHGFLLALAALWALERAASSRASLWIAAAGLCVGLAVLTKAEVACAGALACLARLLALAREPAWRGRRVRIFVLAILSTCAPVLVCFLALLAGRTGAEALRTTLGAFAYFPRGDLLAMPFYRAGMGIDAPADNVDKMLHWTLGWALALGVPALLARSARLEVARTRPAGVLAFAVSAIAWWLVRERIDWGEVARPFPLALLALAIDAVVELVRRPTSEDAQREAARLALAIFALALIAKIVLATRLLHYGFVLALPGALLCVAVLVESLPRWVGARRGAATALRGYYLGLLATIAAVHVSWTSEWVVHDDQELGAGADRMRVSTRGKLAAQALEEILVRSHPGSTLLVLPEGVTLDYLARLASPTRYVNFMPPELLLWGEPEILAALDANPPDLVAIVHKDTSEYGAPLFGTDYGARLYAWIRTRYRQVALFGNPPLVDRRSFGIALLERVR
jgi:hypothetical protein